MSWYRTGTVTVTSNSDVVNGVGTDWISSAKEGETLLGPDNLPYEIVQLLSATQLRIRPAYRGNTAAGQVYAIMPTQSYMRDLASQVSQLINNYSGVRDNAGTGKFAAGTAGVPSLRGLNDQDTGINFPGDNLLQLTAGGVVQLGIDALGKLTGPVASALVIERGENANGSYTRFADGRQICQFSAAPTFLNASNLGYTWTYPAAFIDTPWACGNYVGANLGVSKQFLVSAYNPSAAGVTVSCLSAGQFAPADANGVTLQMMATGYYK